MRQALIAAVLLLGGCVGSPPIIAASSACSTLLPSEWLEGVQAPPLPDGQTVGDWIQFADGAVGQLDKANDRYKAAVGVVSRCERRDRESVRKSKPKFLGVFG
jgi:hypothetical protein